MARFYACFLSTAKYTEIWSDQWRAYQAMGLGGIGYLHQTVNHSQHFVDPFTGVHTNNIEARWAACKATMKRRYGVVAADM